MAIAMARQENRYHSKNMSIEAQAEEVDRVKRSENGSVITDAFYLSPDRTLADANELMAKFRISGVRSCENGKSWSVLSRTAI